MTTENNDFANLPIIFQHRINHNFYESMNDSLNRMIGLADVMEFATATNDGQLMQESLFSVFQLIRLEALDGQKMLNAYFRTHAKTLETESVSAKELDDN